jgi:hypothetical protein
MAEIRYPGVYVVETEASVTPIPGVDTVMDDETFAALVRDLHRTVHQYAPAWTDFNVHDPGVTLVQLLAWLAEAAGYRAHRLPASALGDAVRFATKAMALLDCASAASGAAVRPRFFAGQLLTDDDLRQEVETTREQRRLHNRLLHGYGVAQGLAVQVETEERTHAQCVVVAPGVALDPRGEMIEVCGPDREPLPPAGDALWVAVRYVGGPCRQTHPDTPAPRRRRYALECVATPAINALALARLLRVDGAWRLDSTYGPRRLRPPDPPEA